MEADGSRGTDGCVHCCHAPEVWWSCFVATSLFVRPAGSCCKIPMFQMPFDPLFHVLQLPEFSLIFNSCQFYSGFALTMFVYQGISHEAECSDARSARVVAASAGLDIVPMEHFLQLSLRSRLSIAVQHLNSSRSRSSSSACASPIGSVSTCSPKVNTSMGVSDSNTTKTFRETSSC